VVTMTGRSHHKVSETAGYLQSAGALITRMQPAYAFLRVMAMAFADDQLGRLQSMTPHLAPITAGVQVDLLYISPNPSDPQWRTCCIAPHASKPSTLWALRWLYQTQTPTCCIALRASAPLARSSPQPGAAAAAAVRLGACKQTQGVVRECCSRASLDHLTAVQAACSLCCTAELLLHG
jgi:hypothetical protein